MGPNLAAELFKVSTDPTYHIDLRALDVNSELHRALEEGHRDWQPGWAANRIAAIKAEAAKKDFESVCNLYSQQKGQAEIIAFARAVRDISGNLPALPAIFPDQLAPIIRNTPDGARELAMARWGMPPAQFPGAPPTPVTNVRNVSSKHWQPWLGQANRCVVPFTSFCEYADAKPRKTPTWFALDDSRP